LLLALERNREELVRSFVREACLSCPVSLRRRHPGAQQSLWCVRRRDLFAPARAAVGLHPDREPPL